jgi:aspartate/methionine/tyrosine aminotransferase
VTENTKQVLSCFKLARMQYKRMPIEVESPEQLGYGNIKNNLSESSYTDLSLGNMGDLLDGMGDLLLCYGSHEGHEGLRKLLAKETVTLAKEDVLLTTGAAGALFIIATTLLEKDSELLVMRPNYATNIETPKAIGASIKYLDLHFENGFRPDMSALKKLVTKNTRYISVTNPHNPTGACLTDGEMKELVTIAQENDTWLLVDETYRDMVFGEKLPVACDYSDRVISVSSLSKTYGLPGIRMGWILCRHRQLMETFLAAKEQIQICGSVLDEEVAYRYLLNKDKYFVPIRKDIAEKFRILKTWMDAQDVLEWVEPRGGVVCFPRLRRPEKVDTDKFYDTLLGTYGTYTGPGHWFGMPRHYMRIGYGWPMKQQLVDGLAAIGKSLREASLNT